MAHVISIEERTQNINVEQRSHSVSAVFTQSINLFIGVQTSATFKWHEAPHSRTSGLGGRTGERLPNQLRQHCTCRPIRLSSDAFSRFQHIVIYVEGRAHESSLRI
jgi:hypothetical protein